MIKYRKFWVNKKNREYTIHGNMSGICEENSYAKIKTTKVFIIAMFWTLIFKIKYPQVIVTLDGSYIECKDCPYICKK